MEITNYMFAAASRLAQGLSSTHSCLCIPSVNQSLKQKVPYLSAIYCLFHSAISPKLSPLLPSRLMKIRFYWLGSPTSGFGGAMRGAGGRKYRFICGTVREMGCLFNRYLFQLYTVDIKLERRRTVELFGKRSQCCLTHCIQSICSVEEIQFSAQAKLEWGDKCSIRNVSSCFTYSL